MSKFVVASNYWEESRFSGVFRKLGLGEGQPVLSSIGWFLTFSRIS